MDFIGVLLFLRSRMTEACWYLSLIAIPVFMFWFASFRDDFGSRQSAGIQDNRPLALWVTETVPCDADHISSEVRWISRRRSNTWEQALIQELSIPSWAIWPHLYFRYCVKNINICHTLTGSFLQFDWQRRLIAWVTLRNKSNCFWYEKWAT